jgi:hypothetical protein
LVPTAYGTYYRGRIQLGQTPGILNSAPPNFYLLGFNRMNQKPKTYRHDDELNEREALIITTMDRLMFSPCTRYRDIVSIEESRDVLEDFGVPNFELLREINLNISTEELLSAERAFTYADLYTRLENGDQIAWLTPHAFIARSGGPAVYAWMRLDDSCRFRCIANGKEIIALARSPNIYWKFATLFFGCWQ